MLHYYKVLAQGLRHGPNETRHRMYCCTEIAGEPSYMSRKELNMALAGSMLS